MKKVWMVLLWVVVLTGCGHKQIEYTPRPVSGMDRQQAIDIVEQVFYEDFSKGRPQSVQVTEQFIALSDGTVSNGTTYGTAAPLGNGAVAVGSSTVTTKERGQRLYFSSISSVDLYQSNVRKGRYAVIIRAAEGGQVRTVRTLSLEKAQRFVDALEYLRIGAGKVMSKNTLP
ncbi:hypothetical protein ACW9ID_04255 [Pseudomonas gingeri]